MSPTAKTLLIVVGSVLGIFIVPAVLIIFHDYINAFIFIMSVLACFILFGYYSYEELLPVLKKAQLEEDEIMARFAGDPEKIRFYRGFKKHFNGELNLKELEQWFLTHPRKH